MSGYLYYATGTSRGAIFNRQFWIYGSSFRQITAAIEIVLLLLLYLWTFFSFRALRVPERMHLCFQQQIRAYIGCAAGYILYSILFDVTLPHFIMTRFFSTKVENGIRLIEPVFYHTYTFLIDSIGLLWIAVLLVGARMLYESPATLNDTWGYKTFDNNWKDVQKVKAIREHLNTRGINYLLNVGPDYLGRIPAPAADILRGAK